MKARFLTTLLVFAFITCKSADDRYIFFLHNAFLETHDLNDEHPQYGRAAYTEIIDEFENAGFKVISEKRNGSVNVKEYARKIVAQMDSLIKKGITPNQITVVGTSKGGYIAQYVSTFANNPEVNFVFIASFHDSDIQNVPDINYCGNILTIYERSDSFGSALKRKVTSTCTIKHYEEVELNTGLRHGFLFKSLKEWIEPCINWAKGNYDFKE